MTPDEWAARIFEATNIMLPRGPAQAIGQMIEAARDEALAEAALVVMAKPMNEDGLSYFEIMNRDQDMMLEIMALQTKPAP